MFLSYNVSSFTVEARFLSHRSTILILYFIRNLLVHFYIQLSNSLNKLFVRFEAHLVKIIQFNYFVTLFLALSAIF